MRMNTRSNRIEASTASPIPGIAATSDVGFGDGRDQDKEPGTHGFR